MSTTVKSFIQKIYSGTEYLALRIPVQFTPQFIDKRFAVSTTPRSITFTVVEEENDDVK